MKILALIPARGGSKRLPGKNVRNLGGKPLISWSIEIAKQLNYVCDVLVSTDDEEIASIARISGALVPWLRPLTLSNDESTSTEVALHALNLYELENGEVDAVLLLQPTSPFRSLKKVKMGIEIFNENRDGSIVGVSPCPSHPYWCLRIENSKLVPFFNEKKLSTQSQKLPGAYIVNGSFYLISTKNLRMYKTFYGKNMIPLVIDNPRESLDIDTADDWALAEHWLNLDNKISRSS